MARLVLISGPPQSGKSTAGKAIAAHFGADLFAVSDRLKLETHAYYRLPKSLAPDHFEGVKDQPLEEFAGLSPRQAYIFVSEKIIKPQFGDGFLGHCAAQRLRDDRYALKVITGTGFIEEVIPLVEAVGSDNTLHIRVTPEASHARSDIEDSRHALNLTSYGVAEIDLSNPFDGRFMDDVIHAVSQFMELSPAPNPASLVEPEPVFG